MKIIKNVIRNVIRNIIMEEYSKLVFNCKCVRVCFCDYITLLSLCEIYYIIRHNKRIGNKCNKKEDFS